MDDQERYDRFLSALGFRARMEATPTGSVDLVDLDGAPVEPAVRLHVCARSLGAHVRDDQGRDPEERQTAERGEAAEPDELDDPEAARLQTLLAQIEEAILVRSPGHDHLVLVDGGVRAVAAQDVPGLAAVQ